MSETLTDHAHLFAMLPLYTGVWDGHTTDEKYARIAAITNGVYDAAAK